MRIVVWNCNMALHRKMDRVRALEPDIAVIAECATPEILASKCRTPLGYKAVWVGKNQTKGLAVFSREQLQITLDSSHDPDLRELAPVRVTGPVDFRLLAAWSFNRRENLDLRKRGPLRRVLEDKLLYLSDVSPLIVAGDFNSSVRFNKSIDRGTGRWIIGDLLAEIGLISAYHSMTGCQFGEEPDPTIYWKDRSQAGRNYHIDYCFIPRTWMNRLKSVSIGGFGDWIEPGLSDHVPLIVDVDL